MAVLGDRELAGLLSAIAEAPDIAAATSHLLTQLADLTASRRAMMLKLDAAQHSLVAVASVGFPPPTPAFSISLGDLSSPLVVSALSLVPVRGASDLSPQQLGAMGAWLALPMSQPLQRGSLGVMKRERAAELVARTATMLASLEHRVATAPAGVVVLSGDFDDATTAAAIELIVLASPIVARVAALHESSELANRLAQHRERLTLVVDSLPDPVVITNAANDIVVQNHRAGRLLQARDDDSVGRRRAVELNNLLLTALISSTRTRAPICCSRCSRIRSGARVPRTPCCQCCAT
jgi:PAS domain-containing protein